MKSIVVLFLFSLSFYQCSSAGGSGTQQDKPTKAELSKLATAYFASGCFWCVEAVFESVAGVKEAVSGYAGGTEQRPSYKQVSAGSTGHAETVQVYYDPREVSFKTLVEVYYSSQDPTTPNGQYPDFGRQYRSIIFYQTTAEQQIARDFKDSLNSSGVYDKPIATEISAFQKFWEAEDYHQDFERRNPYHPYIMSVSIPRLKKFKKKHPELLKRED